MIVASIWLSRVQSAVIIVALIFTACKTLRLLPFSQIERSSIIIWLFMVLTVTFKMSYKYYYDNNFYDLVYWEYYLLLVLNDIFVNLTIWKFCWQILKVAVEV